MEMEEQNAAGATPQKLRQVDTIMVVDDDDNWIFVSKLILKKASVGNEIITAKNGRDALSKLKAMATEGDQKMPDLIFLDIRMPVLDGFEFLEEATQPDGLDFTRTRIYMCSSSLNPVDQAKASQFPVSGFLTKPLTQAALQEILG
ncbi:hypothetical protein TH63_14835 [Rufibacter radiotolerans]|uniref:Response regulatory domain-containing protein n=2 Tax=Rufibacter radiotolerans TaxID=1379910 RepID=A0A0H4VRR4_9BACT|nr:hypothetical protein TH63_14835 [Rufibacter radiotolerans]